MIKFPKEKALIYNQVNKALDCEDYDIVFKYKRELMESFDELENTDIYIGLIKALFYKEHYQDVIIITEELLRRGYERFEIVFYVVFSSIALDDIYTGYGIIRRYQIMNDSEMKCLFSEYGTYTQALNYPFSKQKAIIAASLMQELLKEYSSGVNNEDGFLGLRVFEFINSLLELGYEKEIINELVDIAKLIFIAYN